MAAHPLPYAHPFCNSYGTVRTFQYDQYAGMKIWHARCAECKSPPLSSSLVGWLVLGLYDQLTKCSDGRPPMSVYSSLPTIRTVTMKKGLGQSLSSCCMYRLLVFEQTENRWRRPTHLPCLLQPIITIAFHVKIDSFVARSELLTAVLAKVQALWLMKAWRLINMSEGLAAFNFGF